MINCYCYRTYSDKREAAKEEWMNKCRISFALSIITMIGAAFFYGTCLIHNPVIQWSQTEFFLSLTITSLVFLVGSVFCGYIAEKKNNPELKNSGLPL